MGENLPRPPAHDKYDLKTKQARRRKGDVIRGFCIAFIIILLLALGICVIVLLLSFKKAEPPKVQMKHVAVSKFSVASPLVNKYVLSTDMEFSFEFDNKNRMIGLKFRDLVLDVTWDEIDGHLGETRVNEFHQRSNGASVMKIKTHGEVEITKKELKEQDLNLDISLSGELKYVNGPFKTDKYPILITCNDITVSSSNAACTTEVFTDGISKLSSPVAIRELKESLTLTDTTTTTPEENAPLTGLINEAPEPQLPPLPPQPLADLFPPVKVTINDEFVILENGIVAATITKPDGFVTGIKYNGIDNILDEVNPPDDRGYWDVVWAPPGTKGTKGTFLRVVAKEFRVIVDNPEQIELSFKLAYDPAKSTEKDVPMELDIRYVMLRGVSGIYSYGIFKRAAWPAFGMPNARLAFKLQREKFKYMVLADNRQREMPVPEDRLKPRGQPLEYPEAVLLINPIDPKFKGEVDDKYQYSEESQDIKVHGWICKDPPTGFWQITPSFEFRSGGANKQFLTSHVGPSTLAMFVSAHYSGEELVPKFEKGEPWNHVYGPMLMYMNNATKDEDFHSLWDDAKTRMHMEINSWPYAFPASEDFPKANERVNVTGKFFVHDKTKEKEPAKNAFIGLGPPGEAGSWQRDCKHYQFWTQTDEQGNFKINFVRVGHYNLFGWVDGYIGDYKYDKPIDITVGQNIDVGEIVFEPPRDGPTLWEIGIPDRVAAEFFIPDPNPKYVNPLYVNHPDKFRQYGLWERYAEIYPKDDLVYDVKTSNYSKDWFFAHVTRKVGKEYDGTTWQVKFTLDNVEENAVYKLRMAIASATNSDIEVRFNEPKPSPSIFKTGRIGNDNSIARHGIHGLYWLYTVDVKGSSLRIGDNTLFLTQTKGTSPFQGIMYDYIRLEGPSSTPT